MKRLHAGHVGLMPFAPLPNPSDLTSPWPQILAILSNGCSPRPVQHAALADDRILNSCQNVLVSAPTNSGKSLVGYLLLLHAVLQGRRAILIEPLRAVAQEQYERLAELLPRLVPSALRRAPVPRLTTGDYRLQGESFASAPAEAGEIVVATPERLDAILRNPKNRGWAESIGAVVIDEAHLIGDSRRGPTLEFLVAALLSMPRPPRLGLLSATLGDPSVLQQWLAPCQAIISDYRTPLSNEVWELADDEDADGVLIREIKSVLQEPTNAVMVFVYRRSSAEALARKLSESMERPARAYHSAMASEARAAIRASYSSGSLRCLVSTTSLAMGVNLPATHVFLRDTTFHGSGKLGVAEILQILGRAGRGDRAGTGVVLARTTDEWAADTLAAQLGNPKLPGIRSTLALSSGRAHLRASSRTAADQAAASLVAAYLSRVGAEGADAGSIAQFMEHTLAGKALVERVPAALRWLVDPSRTLAYQTEQGRFHLTVLGRTGVRAMLPLDYCAGFGQLIRDFLSLDLGARLLRRWSALDHLLVAGLLSDRGPPLRRFSEELAGRIDAFSEAQPLEEKSLLFSEWISGAAANSRADELYGSLGLSPVASHSHRSASARHRGYLAMLGAIILHERSRGVPPEAISARWGVSEIAGIEESWRDQSLWLMSGHASLCDIRTFYFHVRETCAASPDKVKEMKRALTVMRRDAYELMERLKYCSALGGLLRGVKASRHGPPDMSLGIRTIRQLESAGITSLGQIVPMSVEQLVATGIQKRFARQIRTYMSRRLK